ncbi:FAD-dependent pyridine nucleotide-disulphide oxidoreductase [Moorella glycerini]|uniref:Fumarate reductase flavoprotein subunit n=1 Tax=Neomoorella stamsii TaxID=1266720 RepID=A0A9X7P6R9_9FIRM|nr:MULTISPECIES: FAD-dependent oxidoreductase [Moorella]PRR73570.1 Fumarate reductase flavoprotein subunit [Moorella stamsii]CEP69339.1 FAD-dependent pyridine nucleotide-disulphide oxidoreductase [Moorella glycerini]
MSCNFSFANLPEHQITTDVLVIGGGSAGTMAALAARRQGLEVALVDKAGIDRSGCGCAGNDHFLAILESGPEWDTREAFLKWYHRLTQGLVDMAIPEKVFLSRIKRMVAYLEELGIPMRLNTAHNDYIRTGSFGQPGDYFINFDGRKLKPTVSAEAARAGVKFFRRINITDLLLSNGAVSGAVGFDIRKGDFYTFLARATIVATGNVTRLYNNQAGMPYNSWHSPYNNGGAQAMAFRAGAELKNMEFVNYTLTPVNFSASALNAIVGMGGYIVNGLGERFLFKYHEKGEKGPRWVMPWGVYWEIKEGRGPCYFDLRHLPEESLNHLLHHLLPVDKNTFLDYCWQKGVDLRKDLLEVQISEGQLPAFLGSVSGIYVTPECATTVPGLFAAGACAVTVGSLSGSMCVGETAGEEAATFISRGGGVEPVVSREELNARREAIYDPLNRRDGLKYYELENKLRQVMTLYVGIGRTARGLQAAVHELDKLEKLIEDVRAGNLHELMRTHELRDLLLVARAITRGALEREESRFGLSHYRGDFPSSREEWHCSLHQRLENAQVVLQRVAPSSL